MLRSPSDEEAHLEGARAESIASYRNLLADRDGRLAALRKSQGPGSDRWKRLATRLQHAEEKTRAIFAKLQRLTDGKRISQWALLVGAIVLAILEAPINKFMLDNILRGSNFDSYVLSLFLTLALLLLAHIAGTQSRQIRSAYHEKIYISNIVVTVLILIVLAACVGALTIGRAFYSTTAGGPTSGDIFVEVTRQVLVVGPFAAFVAALSDKAAFFLACLNTAGISLAFLVAFIAHDSDMAYQAGLDDVDRTDRSLFRMQKKYDRLVERTAQQFSPRLSNVAAAHGSQNAKIVALKRARNAPLTEEDRFDLSSLDSLLNEARAEIGAKSSRGVFNPGTLPDKNNEASAVAQFVAHERR